MISKHLKSNVYRIVLSYFYSGWSFFIPYLFAYLVYYWTKWPINPADYSVKLGTLSSENSAVHWIPCLLHVYWTLHASHLVLGAIALRFWWKNRPHRLPFSNSDGPQSTRPRSSNYSLLDTLYKAMPWFCLALVFYIPGVYLEWPSDPWEHLRRINEWHSLNYVTDHSSWPKSSYFLSYSLTGHTTGLTQLSWLNFYCTATCLLLSWQYYRLAKAVGISQRGSLIFILLNTLTFGNNVFSYYRYYELSSSILAQIGAIALTRIMFETLDTRNRAQGIKTNDQEDSSILAIRHSLVRSMATGLFLLPLMALNHIQALAIGGLGVLATMMWRLVKWKRSMIGILPGASVTLCIALLIWLPRDPAHEEALHLQGWMNAWYGFNFFSSPSPTLDHSLQVLGVFGILNVAIGMWLAVRHNHIVGWLSIMPVLFLVLPCTAIPLSHALTARGPNGIITFHRLLFAIPAGLALVTTIERLMCFRITNKYSPSLSPSTHAHRTNPFNQLRSLIIIGVLFYLVIAPSGFSFYNHFWHSIMRPPADLQLRHFVATRTSARTAKSEFQYTMLVNSTLEAQVYESFTPNIYINQNFFRWATIPDAVNILESFLKSLDTRMQTRHEQQSLTWYPMVYTPASQAARISRHWAPWQVALDHERFYKYSVSSAQ